MKKVVKSNPLKTFNDNKALAVKKMGGAQASFKKKLPEAQLGAVINGLTKLKKVHSMYNAAKQTSKLTKSSNAKKPTKSGVTKSILKLFNAIKYLKNA